MHLNSVDFNKIPDLTEYLKTLTDEDFQKERRVAAEKAVREYTVDEWKAMRRRCKTDKIYLAHIIGFRKLDENLHGHLAKWMAATEDEQFREILLPRGTYKTSIATVTDSVQIALPDDVGDQLYPRNLGTNVRVAITHEIEKQASKYLGAIAGVFMNNSIIMGLFPECVPTLRVQTINTTQLELPRTDKYLVESTFEAFNVGARSQGRHYNFLKLDDLIGDAARDSETIMQAAKDWFDNIQSFFSEFATDHFDLIGTRWALDDLYAHVHEVYGDQIRKYIRSLEERDKDGNKVSIFPRAFPLEKIKILKKNKKVYAAQYGNDPLAGAGEFEEGWKQFFTWENDSVIRYKTELINLAGCDIVIFYDPALTGTAGYAITAGDSKDRIFVVKAKAHIWKPPEFINELFLDVKRWQPRLVVIESVLFSEIYQHYVVSEQARRDIRFRIEPAKTRQKTKDARIRGLESYFSDHRIIFCEDQEDLITEFDVFGASKKIHILDALAYGPEFWRRGSTIARESQTQQNTSQRDIITGYSRYP